MRNTVNQFEDYYYGGWQDILPNSPTFNYRGAVLGLHGEVTVIPWKYAILNDSAEEVAGKLWTRALRMPFIIEKIFSLHKGFRLKWNGDLFKTLWLWQERYATLDFPWWGQCYTIA